MKSKFRAFGVIIVIAVVIVFVINANQPTLDSQIVSECVNSGGMFNITSNTCVPKGTAITANGSVKNKPSSPVVSTPKPANPVVTKVTENIHIIPGSNNAYYSTSSVSSMITVNNPPTNSVIASPVTLAGLARGPWYFEASAPVILTDAKGVVIARTNIRAQSNWMTNDFVPFMGTLTFTRQTSGSRGVIIFKKDNPSGMTSRDMSIEIPVVFQ